MPNGEHCFVHLNIIVYYVFSILIKGEYNMVVGVLALMRKGSQYKPSLKMLKLLLWLMLICKYRYCGIINICGGSMLVFYFVGCPLPARLHLQRIVKLIYNYYIYRNESMKLYLLVPIKENWQSSKISPTNINDSTVLRIVLTT